MGRLSYSPGGSEQEWALGQTGRRAVRLMEGDARSGWNRCSSRCTAFRRPPRTHVGREQIVRHDRAVR
jgi:hypothetical protein